MASSINIKIAPLPRGEYSSSATYAKLDVVSYNGSSYMAIKAVPTGTVPTNTTYWQVLAEAPTISEGSITTDKLADGAVTTDKLADDSVSMDILDEEVKDLIYGSYPTDVASGSVASFPDGADAPVKGLELKLEPYQNLNGYGHPWVGGGNGNYLPNNATDGTTTLNGITLKEANGVYSLSGTASAETTFNISLSASVDLSPSTNKICFLNSAAYSAISVGFTRSGTRIHYWSITPSNRVISGWTDSGNEVIDGVRIVIANGIAISGTLTISPMLVKTTDTSPTSFTPYSNICPIYPANGKNILPNNLTWTGGLRDDNGNPTASGTSHYSNSFPCEPNTTYTGQGIKTDSTSWRIYFLTADETWISRTEQITDTVASFTTPSNCYFMQVQCRYTNDLSTNAQIERGNSPTQYVPYKAIGITRTGANLWDEEWEQGGINGNGVPVSGTTRIRSKNFCPILPNTTYYATCGKTDGGNQNRYYLAVFFYDADKNFISYEWANNLTFTTPSNAYYFKLSTNTSVVVYGGTYNNDISINYPSSVQTYQQYQGERYYPISDNPVYGGTLEVETGLLTVTHNAVDMGTLTWTQASTNTQGVYRQTSASIQNLIKRPSSSSQKVDITCSNYKTVAGDEVYLRYHGICVTTSGGVGVYDEKYSADGSSSAFKTSVEGATLVYPLATPVQYQLTPVQVKTLLGYNNIWTDSGTVEVNYLADTSLYIQKLTGSTEEDMIANANIANGKYFMVGNELFLSTSAIAQGASIVVGTNCIKTNLADALNALNS